MAFYSFGEIEARHLTGRTRYRQNIFGRLILQVEEKWPKPRYPRPPQPPHEKYDPWSAGHFFVWRDARLSDLQVDGTIKVPQ